MLSAQDRRKLRQIEIKARRSVQTLFAGAYASTYKGQGLTFANVRPYAYGDDFRMLDWKISARTGIPHVREFVAEREQTVMIVLDGSASLFFGTDERTKRDKAAELAVILATCAMINQDRVGLLIFTDDVEVYLPPRRSRSHGLHLLERIWTYQPHGKATDLNAALRALLNGLRSHTIVFLLSDFLTPPSEYERSLIHAAQKHDLTAFYIYDPVEHALPAAGMMALQDAESQQITVVDTKASAARTALKRSSEQHQRMRDHVFQRAGVSLWEFPLMEDVIISLGAFFKHKQQLLKR
jgi:uncharacterized protein (DUF58 family)